MDQKWTEDELIDAIELADACESVTLPRDRYIGLLETAITGRLKPALTPSPDYVMVPRDVVDQAKAALEFYGHIVWLPKWSCNPTTGVTISETETYLSDSIHEDKGQRARDTLAMLDAAPEMEG